MTGMDAAAADLRNAMALFEETTAKLRGSYDRLQEEVRELRGLLEQKDRELGRSRAERDRLTDYLEHLLESVPSGVVAVDGNGEITTINRAAQEITGLDSSAVGALFTDVFPLDDENVQAETLLNDLKRKIRPMVKITRQDGENALLGIRVSPFRGNSGNPSGKVSGKVVVFQDVTKLRRLEEQQTRNQRLVAMGEMAAGLAHEIRNPLGSLELFASHLAEELTGTPHEELSGHILKGIRNLSRISGNLLLYARKVKPELSPVRVDEILKEALLYARAAVSGKSAVLEESLCEAPADADPNLLRQVFLNLILNAVQAVEEGGRIRATCSVEKDDDAPMVLVKVADNGQGVPPEARERIFDPFFTTRSGGMGLGLAIVQRIVSAHGGWVSVVCSDLGGAEFVIGIPGGILGRMPQCR